VKNKEVIFFTGQETNAKENLENLSRSILSISNDFSAAAPTFQNFNEAFEAIFNIAEKRRIVMVIDEYPYLASSYKGISSLLQVYIDKFKNTSKLFLILCGSSLSFMENQVLGYQSPLFGRRTAQFKIHPFDFSQTLDFFGNSFSIQDIVTLYGITGGIPLYLALMDKEKSVADNIKSNFLKPSAYLYEEPGNLIKQECREPAQYNVIIKSIANGASRLSEISSKAGIETALCSSYISKLISIGIIRKEYPFREETSKKTIYRLEDSMFRFWYRFIPGIVPLIERRETEMAYNLIMPYLADFLGPVFEEICKQYLWYENLNGNLPISFYDAGRWWGNNPRKHEQCEIDVIADNQKDAIFAECKWIKDNVKYEVLVKLINNSEIFNFNKKYYYLFAKSGFSGDLESYAVSRNDVTLVRFDEMYG
jgi:AAA+ ATPase superfamily predicted ATPase